MGLFDFNDSRPRVTPHEFKEKVRGELYGKGLTHKELDQIEGMFVGDMHEGRPSERGVDADEITHRMNWLRENKHTHTLSDEQIGHVEEAMRKHL